MLHSSPEIQLTNTHLLSVIVRLTFLCHARAHTSSVMLGLGVDSWRERAISEVRGLRDERGPTQVEIYTRTSLSWIPGSRYACPRMTEEKIILSLPDLIRQSTNTRHLLTICTQKATRFNKGPRRSRCCGQAGYSLRASTKIRTAAGVAVKLATACKTTKKTRCFFTKAAAFSRLTKFIRLSDRSEPEFDASVHSRAVVRG